VFVIETVDSVTGDRASYAAEDVVMGIGTQRHIPEQFEDFRPRRFHSASYLHNRDRCLDADSITIVGSGQSAAEVFRDLVERQPDRAYSIDWITRSRGFFQMADAKLGHMIYTPDYIDYFYDLGSGDKRPVARVTGPPLQRGSTGDEREDLRRALPELYR